MVTTADAAAYLDSACEDEIPTWLHKDVMEHFLVQLGWKQDSRFPCWIAPDVGVYWHLDEAFRVAVTREVLEKGASV